MRTPRPVVVLLALAAVGLATVDAGAQAAKHSKARTEIDEVNARFITAFNSGDVSKFAQVYTTDATLMPSNSPPIHGRPAIEQFWQGGWKMGIRNVKLTTTELDVHGEMASEVGKYEFDVQPATGPASHDHGKYIVLWKRIAKGEWRWHRDIFNTDVPMANAAEQHGQH